MAFGQLTDRHRCVLKAKKKKKKKKTKRKPIFSQKVNFSKKTGLVGSNMFSLEAPDRVNKKFLICNHFIGHYLKSKDQKTVDLFLDH